MPLRRRVPEAAGLLLRGFWAAAFFLAMALAQTEGEVWCTQVLMPMAGSTRMRQRPPQRAEVPVHCFPAAEGFAAGFLGDAFVTAGAFAGVRPERVVTIAAG